VKLLVLGGTLFVGRHVVEAALARGHEVTLLNRGRSNPELFPEAEKLRGDRDGDLSALGGRRWDTAIDVSARLPRWVRTSTGLLADSVEHYTFVSSVSVYADTSSPGTDESAVVHRLEDEGVEEITSAETYGALKALCEQAAEETLPGRVLSVRAGLIVGPYDGTGRFTYWVHRIARGGNVLTPEPRDQPVQFVHARDLADWILAMAESRRTGLFKATGPESPLTMERLLEAIGAATGSDANLAWRGARFLEEAGVEAWSDLPLWLGTDPDIRGLLSVDISKALTAGLTFRPLSQTIQETLAGAGPTSTAGLDPKRERALLAA
jgi:2'-hydroxyisoflavone reductase